MSGRYIQSKPAIFDTPLAISAGRIRTRADLRTHFAGPNCLKGCACRWLYLMIDIRFDGL